MADFRSPNFFTPNLAASNESMVDYLYAARIKIKKGSWLSCGIQDLYSKYKIRPLFGLLRCGDSRLLASRVLKLLKSMAHVIRFQSLYI